MKSLLSGTLQKAIAAAATLTGKRFALLVASSLVATSGVVAVGLSGSSNLGSLAAAAGLLNGSTPTATEAPAPAPEATSSPKPATGGNAATPEPLPAPAPAEPEAVPASKPEAPPAAEPELPEAGPIKHVFLVSLTSPGYDAAFGAATQMPYLAGTLRPQGMLLTGYSLLDEAALPNGIAVAGGQAPTTATRADCPSYEKCIYPVETLTLPDQLAGGRFSWHAYLEGMADEAGKPDNCVYPAPGATETPTGGGYVPYLNPFVYFHSLLDLGDCATNDVPGEELAKDLGSVNSTANFSYISPSLCNAGFRGQCPEGAPDGAAAADAFLARVAPEILASPAYKRDGLLIVSFGAADPAPPTDPAATPADPLKAGALLVSPLLTPGSTDGSPYNPYSLLRSIEDLFGLSPLAAAGGDKVRSFAPKLLQANGGD